MENSAFAVMLAPYFGILLILIFGLFWGVTRSLGRLDTRLSALERAPLVVADGATAPRRPVASKNRPQR